MATSMKATKADWLIPAGLLLLSFVPALAGTMRLAQLASGAAITPDNARFFASPWPVVLHIPAVVIYSIVGAFQFSPGFRRRHRSWHRAAGKVLVPLGFVVALSGLWMAHFYPWPENDGVAVYVERLIVGTAMFAFLALGVREILRRNYVAHGEWMTRAYAIGMGAATQVLTHLPWFIFVGPKPGLFPRAVMMGAAWVINAVFAEWIIRRRRAPSPQRVAFEPARA